MRVFFSVFCLFPLFLFSQSFKGGVLAGIASTQVSGDGLGGFNKFTPQFGCFVGKKLSDSLQVEMQLYYLQKGSRKAANGIIGNLSSYKLQLNYIEIPLLLRYNYKNKFNIEAGLSGAVMFKSKVSNAYGELSLNDPENRPFRKWESAFLIGISYPVKKNTLIYIRNSNSILPIRKHLSNNTFRLNFGQYNSVMQIGLQFLIE